MDSEKKKYQKPQMQDFNENNPNSSSMQSNENTFHVSSADMIQSTQPDTKLHHQSSSQRTA